MPPTRPWSSGKIATSTSSAVGFANGFDCVVAGAAGSTFALDVAHPIEQHTIEAHAIEAHAIDTHGIDTHGIDTHASGVDAERGTIRSAT